MKKLWGYLSSHPLWITVIGTVIGSIVIAVIFSETTRTFLKNSWLLVRGLFVSFNDWSLSFHAVPGVVILGMSILSIFAIVYFLYEIKPGHQKFLKYKEEHFYGIDWSWTWIDKSKGMWNIPKYPSAYCPNCSSYLKINSQGYDPFTCINDNCDWTWEHTNKGFDYEQVTEKLSIEINRKARALISGKAKIKGSKVQDIRLS